MTKMTYMSWDQLETRRGLLVARLRNGLFDSDLKAKGEAEDELDAVTDELDRRATEGDERMGLI